MPAITPEQYKLLNKRKKPFDPSKSKKLVKKDSKQKGPPDPRERNMDQDGNILKRK